MNWRGRLTADSSDDGSAIVETVFLGVLMIVPLAYALLTAFTVQGAAYALTAGAREAGRAYVTAPEDAAGVEAAQQAMGIALIGQRVAADDVALSVTCAGGDECVPGSKATIAVRTRVALPWLPTFARGPAGITVTAQHHVIIDTYVERPS